MQDKTFRVVNLASRTTAVAGLSLNQAHLFIERSRRADPALRFDIRTEPSQSGTVAA